MSLGSQVAGLEMRSTLLEHWQRHYGDTPMAGWALRERFPRRWVQLWSLPGAQRYATSEAEYAEILLRQNAAITALFGTDSPVWLLLCVYDEEVGPPLVAERVRQLHLEPVATAQGDGGPTSILGGLLSWQPGCIDGLLRAVADDALRLLLVSEHPPRVAAPYDGGLDLVLESEAARDEVARPLSAWRSSHPMGL